MPRRKKSGTVGGTPKIPQAQATPGNPLITHKTTPISQTKDDASARKDRYFVLKTKLEKLSIPEHWSMVGEIDSRYVFEENCPYDGGKPPVLGVDKDSFIALGDVDDELASNFDSRGRIDEALDRVNTEGGLLMDASLVVPKCESDDDDVDMGYLFSEAQEIGASVEIANVEEVVLTCDVISDTADVIMETTDNLRTTSSSAETKLVADVEARNQRDSSRFGEASRVRTVDPPVGDDDDESKVTETLQQAERTTLGCTMNSRSISSVLNHFQEHTCDLCNRRQSSLTALSIHYASVHGAFKTVVKTDSGLKLEDSEPSKTDFRVGKRTSGEKREGDETPERDQRSSEKKGNLKSKRKSSKSIEDPELALEELQPESSELLVESDVEESSSMDNIDSGAEKSDGKRPPKTVSEPKPDFYQCHLCEKKYTSKQNWRQHFIVKHEGKRPYLCDICGKSFGLRPSWAIHMRVHAGYKKPKSSEVKKREDFVCEVCGEKLSSKWNLDYHRRIHTGEKPYACEECGKRFRALAKRDEHVARAHVPLEQRHHACQLCDRQFALARKLNEHMRNEHSTEPVFKCKDCEQSFLKRSLLERHRANEHNNTPQPPAVCDLCGKSYSSASYLKKHLRSHAGEDPYVCDTCGRSFTHRNGLKSHILTHTGEKPFSCDICDKRFTTSSAVTVHRRTHTGEKPYKCQHCSKVFAQLDKLKRHVSRHH